MLLWRRRLLLFSLILLAALISVGTAVAQSDNELRLTLSRDFGTGLGNNIQGTFSFRVSGPDNLASVTFYIDDLVVGKDSEAPFRLQFKTDSYPLGFHTLRAVGIDQNGQELTSNQIRRNFISSSSANRTTLYLVVPIILIVVGGMLLSSWIANRGQKSGDGADLRMNGPFGGTICPKCDKPFARHIWGLNIGVGKYDRCPHCGKWSIVRRVHPDVLAASVEAMQRGEAAESEATSPTSDDDDKWQQRLDDSKFDS